MLEPKSFLNSIREKGCGFFVGVPDSLLKNFCAHIDDSLPDKKHVIAANEGSAVAMATGYYLATGEVPLVYMQNSGLGNAINPLLSLADPAVYGIPMLLLIGWRGEPGIIDEPQHAKQGSVTADLLDSVGIKHSVLSANDSEANTQLEEAFVYMRKQKSPYALLVSKDSFMESNKGVPKDQNKEQLMGREEVLEKIVNLLPNDTIFVGTTGKLSRELYELRERNNEGHEKDFLTVGSMGHASQIALGIAGEKPNKTVVCLDGDGAAIMHLGGLATIGERQPGNYIHFIFNNGVHDSVGGQTVTSSVIDYCGIAESLGYKRTFKVLAKTDLEEVLHEVIENEKPALIECVVKPGSRKNLGRPKSTPKENKKVFREFLDN